MRCLTSRNALTRRCIRRRSKKQKNEYKKKRKDFDFPGCADATACFFLNAFVFNSHSATQHITMSSTATEAIVKSLTTAQRLARMLAYVLVCSADLQLICFQYIVPFCVLFISLVLSVVSVLFFLVGCDRASTWYLGTYAFGLLVFACVRESVNMASEEERKISWCPPSFQKLHM